MNDREAVDNRVCAWCFEPLPPPIDVLVIVHPADGSTVQTCSATCMAEWLNQGGSTSALGAHWPRSSGSLTVG